MGHNKEMHCNELSWCLGQGGCTHAEGVTDVKHILRHNFIDFRYNTQPIIIQALHTLHNKPSAQTPCPRLPKTLVDDSRTKLMINIYLQNKKKVTLKFV